MVSLSSRSEWDEELRLTDMFAVSALQLPVLAAGSLTGDLHKHLCSCNVSEDYGQES